MHRIHHFPGFLIAIEGIDGSGKTTQAHLVQDALQKVLQPRKIAACRTKEPTLSHWGQILRDSALTGRLSVDEELEAFIKDRRQHVEETINPELKDGNVVICDRYYFSSMAYQGTDGVSPDVIAQRNEEFAPEPDLLVVLDIDPQIGLQRIKTRSDRADYFKKNKTLHKARGIFLRIEKPYLLKLDATKKPEELRDLILAKFSEIFHKHLVDSAKLRERTGVTLSLFGDDK